MCKTCGCAAGNNKQLEIRVRKTSAAVESQNLYTRLIGAPGILHVAIADDAGQVTADYSPQRTSRQDIENIISELGYVVVASEERELAHQHGAIAFLKRVFNK